MTRCTPAATFRGPTMALCSFGLMLGTVSCRDESPVEPADPPTTAEAEPSLASAAAPALSFHQVAAGGGHSCGITVGDGQVYCWGANWHGQLGDGTTNHHHTPVKAVTTLAFRQISANHSNTCGVTIANQLYCWGQNRHGQLGDGTTTDRHTPVPSGGTRQFRQVDTRNAHTCAVAAADSRAWCWGYNNAGQIGDGTRTRRLQPVPVAGTLRFSMVKTGNYHTCGVTTDDRAFCWGTNAEGQLGDRSEGSGHRPRPHPVADGHRFRQIAAGRNHNCAVRTDKRAFCWGDGRSGQIGHGKSHMSWWPRPVSGGILFDRVTTGALHSCGEATTDRAYCWGANTGGTLGNGTAHTGSNTPSAVSGGHLFLQLSGGEYHTCGVSNESRAYCWGDNKFGGLGDGTTQDRWTPTPVAGPS